MRAGRTSQARKTLASAGVATLLAASIAAGFAAPAQAAGNAEYGVGIGYKEFTNGGEGWVGSIYVPGVGYMYCIQPGVEIGATADPVVVDSYSADYDAHFYDGSTRANHSAFDANAAFRINYAIGTYGQLDAPVNGYSQDQATWAAATEFYVWSQVMNTYNAPWGSYDTWSSLRARTGAYESEVRAKIDTIAAAAASATPSTGTATGGSGNLTISMTNYKNGFVNVSMTPANATATLTISGATFDANGSNTIAGVTNGQSLAITGDAGVDPDNPNEKYDIRVTGSAAATVQGSGYGNSVRLSNNAGNGTQSLVTTNPVTDVNIQFDLAAGVADPLIEFEPVVTTQAPEYINVGEDFTDRVTASVVDDGPATNPWATYTNGNPVPVVANGTLYGPFTTPPTQSADVPAGAPVAGTAEVSLNGPGTYTANAGASTASGYYTWVWSIDGANQGAVARMLIGEDYSFVDDFGQAVETSLSPMEPTATSSVEKPVVSTGEQVRDTLTVTNSTGEWLDGVEATFQGTAYAVLDGTPPTQGGTVPTENVRVIDTVEITANEPGTYTSPEVTVPDDAGYVVWVWRFDASTQSDPTKFRTGYTWSDDWAVPAETSRVLFEPEVTTVVSSEFVQSGEQFDDILSAYAAKGQWIDGTDVIAEGTLYGPMLALPEESDTAPSWAPIAGTTTQTLSAAGEFTTDSNIVSTESGYYTWVWEIHSASQSAATQENIPNPYDFIDRFAQKVETSITPSQVVATSKVVKDKVALGEGFQDTLDVKLADGSGGWLQANRQRIPVTFHGTAYWVEGATAPVEQDAVPADAVVLAETSIVANGPGLYESEVLPGEDYRKGFVTWVWEVRTEDQPAEFQGYIKEWSDAFGIADETTEVLIPEVATKAQTNIAIGDSFTDTATVTGTMPINGADLHFELYAATKDANGEWVCEAGNLLWTSESTRITTTGEYVSPEAPGQLPGTYHWVEVLTSENGNTISRGECGIPNETTEVVPPTVVTKAQTDVPVGDTFTDTATVTGPVPTTEEHALDLHFELYAATKDENGEWVCEAGNLLWTSESQTVWGREGDYVSPEAPFQNVGDYHWVEVLTAPEFGGAEIHRGECGIPNETTTVVKPEVTTKAQPATKLGGVIFDVATVKGPIAKDGYDLTFAAYQVPTDADGNVIAPEGTAEGDFSWMADTEPVFVTDEAIKVTEEGEFISQSFTPTEYAKFFWVETLSYTPKDAPEGTEPTIVHQGEFGVRLETSFVVDITTQAQERGIAGGNATDTAIVNGFVPDGSTITFSAYKVDINAPQAPNAQDVCTADNLIVTTEPVEIAGGRHDGTEIKSVEVALPDQADDYKVYWIEETHDELGNTISRGVCGEPSETTTVEASRGGLAYTGGDDLPAWAFGILSLGLAAAGIGTWAIRRRITV